MTTSNSDAIAPKLKVWEQQQQQKGGTEFLNDSGTIIRRLYVPTTNEGSYLEKLGFPGEYPFTRGIYSAMYRERTFTMRQYAGFATAADTNARYKFLLSQGQTGLSVAFDLPTQIGYDADDPMAAGEVGRTGVSICSLEDMEILFNGIPLDKVSTSMTINAPAMVLLCMYVAVAEKQGVSTDKLRGTIQNDILKEFSARGTYIFPVQQSMRLVTDTFAYCEKNIPKWNTISISGYHMREAGCTAVQEIAFTFANAIAYVEAAIKIGLDPNSFGERLSFFFASHNDFFEEVAKFRAARRLWSRLMRDRFKVTNPHAMMLRFHTQTAGCTLTAQQPENNAIRVAYQALSAILGGTQSLHTNSKDEALALPTESAAQLALRTQQIAAFETNVTMTADPLAGSYYVENLTDEIERKALEYVKKIDQMGGGIAAIDSGFVQREIHESAFKHQLAVEAQKRIVVRVNQYTSTPLAIPTLHIDESAEASQVKHVGALRKKRNSPEVKQALEGIRRAADTDENLFPYVLRAAKAYATTGEICNILRAIWGTYKPKTIF